MIEPSQQIWKADWMFFLFEENPILKLPRHSHNLAGFEACSSAPGVPASFCFSSSPSSSLSPLLVGCLAEQKLVLWQPPPIGSKDSWVTSCGMVCTKNVSHLFARETDFQGRCYQLHISFINPFLRIKFQSAREVQKWTGGGCSLETAT